MKISKFEELARKEGVYQRARKLYQQGSAQSFSQAKELFASVSDYKDSAVMIQKCDLSLQAQEKQKELEKERQN